MSKDCPGADQYGVQQETVECNNNECYGEQSHIKWLAQLCGFSHFKTSIFYVLMWVRKRIRPQFQIEVGGPG